MSPEKLPPEMRAKRIGTGKYKVFDQVHPDLFLDAVLSENLIPSEPSSSWEAICSTRSDPLRTAER
jgi:hypothetical protein